MSETLWGCRAAGEIAMPCSRREGEDAILDDHESLIIFASFYASDWVEFPAGTPKHGGERHRVTRRFFGPNPFTRGEGRLVAHLWVEPIGLGVVESVGHGFGVYEIAEWPADWPRERER